MILVDTSVWVDHLRRGNNDLVRLLGAEQVLCHPSVIGELACGVMGNRREILSLLRALPQARMADHDEALAIVEKRRLSGSGIGWIDVHLLASARLTRADLWTLDKRLMSVARTLHAAP